jgi:hypothetical protein
MNKVVKKMMYLSQNDKFRKTRGVKWDMYFLYMGFTYAKDVMKVKRKN